jgi:hypothetical protein
MPQTSLKEVLDHLRKMFAVQDGRDLPDGVLLERFRAQRDEAAFTILVQRHGPLVLGVCRRILGDAHAAETPFKPFLPCLFVMASRFVVRLRWAAGSTRWPEARQLL